MKIRIPTTLHNSVWYQKYTTLRISFKVWRNRKDWYRNYKMWRLARKYPGYIADRSGAVPGSADWLTDTEIKYGGIYWAVHAKRSPFDPGNIPFDTSNGGDRMFHRGYVAQYERFLRPYVLNRDQRFVVCEVGILNGTGLAIWCDLFPNSRCIGLDIDISNIKRNMDRLLELGAFGDNSPELYEYDQFVDSTELLDQILDGDKVDIFMDDGIHHDDAIMTTLRSVWPHLSDQFIYFVEDNCNVYKKIEPEYPRCSINVDGELTVIASPSSDTH